MLNIDKDDEFDELLNNLAVNKVGSTKNIQDEEDEWWSSIEFLNSLDLDAK